MTKARTTSPLTRNQKKKMTEVPSEVKLRKIVPEVPRDEAERGELLEDLQVMGCSGFLVERIRQLDPRTTNPVDRGVLEGGLPFQQGRWRIGGPKGRICEGVLQGPAKPEGRILD
jgi:hypothetical protein